MRNKKLYKVTFLHLGKSYELYARHVASSALWGFCRLPVTRSTYNQRSPGKLAPRRPQMRKSKFTESQIVTTLKQVEGGRQVKDVCRELGISEATYYVWKSKYGGMEASDVQRLRDVEAEHAKLKRMYAELAMENHALKDLIAKKL